MNSEPHLGVIEYPDGTIAIGFSLTFGFRESPDCPGLVEAFCLEHDVATVGESRGDALNELRDAVELYLIDRWANGQLENADQPAPEDIQSLPDQMAQRLLFVIEQKKTKPSAIPNTFKGLTKFGNSSDCHAYLTPLQEACEDQQQGAWC